MHLNIVYGCRLCHEEAGGNGVLYSRPRKCEKHNIETERYIHNGAMLPYGFEKDFIAKKPDDIMGLVRKYREAIEKKEPDYDWFLYSLIEFNLNVLFGMGEVEYKNKTLQ